MESEVGRRTSLSEWIRCAVLEASWIVADLERTERFTQMGTEQEQTFLPSLATNSLVYCHFLLYSPGECLHTKGTTLFLMHFSLQHCVMHLFCFFVFCCFLRDTSGSVGNRQDKT